MTRYPRTSIASGGSLLGHSRNHLVQARAWAAARSALYRLFDRGQSRVKKLCDVNHTVGMSLAQLNSMLEQLPSNPTMLQAWG